MSEPTPEGINPNTVNKGLLPTAREKVKGLFGKFLPKRGVSDDQPVGQTSSSPLSTQQPAYQEDNGWKARQKSFGGRKLPERTKVRRVNESTFTSVEYGEKTWTTEQTIRDILQNHLDANTDRFVAQLTSQILDTDVLNPANLSLDQQKNLDNFTYALYLYKKHVADFSPQTTQEVAGILTNLGVGLPLRTQVIGEGGRIDMSKLNQFIQPIEEVPPTIFYNVVDSLATNSQTSAWIGLDQLKSLGLQASRYQIMGIRIEDQGSGFDTKLTAFYKSTKTGRRYLRGKFGEGTKMSEVHLVRNGAKVVMRSNYSLTNGEETQRSWKSRAVLDQDQTVRMKGVEVSVPSQSGDTAGSYTQIDIRNANPEFQKQFREAVDPRRGLGLNCLSYSPEKYYYPALFLRGGLGVSMNTDAKHRYVQGLLVSGQTDTYHELIFSYDFLDASVLQGRDRSILSRSIDDQIERFWAHVDSKPLLKEFIKRSILSGLSIVSSPEIAALNSILSADNLSSDARRRTQEMVFSIMPKILGLEDGSKNVIVNDNQTRDPENASLLTTLERRGFNIIYVKAYLHEKGLSNLVNFHQGRFEVHHLDAIRKMKDSLIGTLDREDEKVKAVEPIFQAAKAEIESFIDAMGIDRNKIFLQEGAIYLESLDPTNELPIELSFDANSGKFVLKMRPDLMMDKSHFILARDYWKMRIEIEMIAALFRKEGFADRNSQLVYAQGVAERLMTLSLHAGLLDVDALPSQFDHTLSNGENKSVQTFLERLANVERSVLGWKRYNQARDLQVSLDNFALLGNDLLSLPGQYQEAIKQVLLSRVIIEQDEVGFYEEDGNRVVFIRKSIDELSKIGNIDDREVYRAGNKLFILNSFPPDSIIQTDRSTLVFWQNQILQFTSETFGRYPFADDMITIDKGALIVKSSSGDLDRGAGYANIYLRILQDNLKKMNVTASEKPRTREMTSLSGVNETPLPLEYGIQEWNNPIRVFEDIVQNHIDADPVNKAYLRYEVVRGGQRVWIGEGEFQPQDQIVGLQVVDQGAGYLPNDIGIMGRSSKKSPLFAGKYGEGQKMVAAACARNGFELVYSSVGQYEGRSYRWNAEVGTRDEQVVVGGVPTPTKRVIFNVNSNELTEQPSFTSSTKLRLTDGVDYQNPDWQRWVNIIDPRNKDEKGNGGLSRYVINLRAPSSNIIDMGYMRILLDEPGKVYENGLFVTETSVALGYDVPEVVITRERNAIDSTRLSSYIAHAVKESTDPRLIQTLLTLFKDKYVSVLTPGEDVSPVERDLNFGWLARYDRFIPSKPIWDTTFVNLFPGYFIHSQEELENRVAKTADKLKKSWIVSDPQAIERYKRDYDKALITLSNVDHVPKDRIIPVGYYEYEAWASVMPSVEDFIVSLSKQEVPVTEQTASDLEEIVRKSASVMGRVVADMEDDIDRYPTYGGIVLEADPSGRDFEKVLVEKGIRESLAFWSNVINTREQPPIFVAPKTAGYLGLATRDRIGFNEGLLVEEERSRVVEVSRHELIHKIFGLRDYSPEFIMMLLELTRYNLSH